MNIAVLQHVAFEDAGKVGELLQQWGHQLQVCHVYKESLPELANCDAVLVMGGPMSAYDEPTLLWLAAEKQFLRAAIAAGKPVLGICLGAQLLADVLGARVYPGPHREIGWFAIETDSQLRASPYAAVFGEQFMAFHWHGDTFTLPDGALPIGTSAACACQGFIWQQRVIGLQFHLEMSADGVAKLAKHCAAELDNSSSPYVQPAAQLAAATAPFADMHERLAGLLRLWLASSAGV